MVIRARDAARIFEDDAGIARQQPEDPTRWPVVDRDALLAACPGVVVVRLGPGDEPEPDWTWDQRAAAVRFQPYVGFPTWLTVWAFLGVHHRLACVVTVRGFPVLLADLVSFEATDDDSVELGLERPGAWSDLLGGRRLVTSPGPPWLLLGAQPYLGRAAQVHARGEPVGAGRSTTWSRWA